MEQKRGVAVFWFKRHCNCIKIPPRRSKDRRGGFVYFALLCQDTFSEPASVQIHLFFKITIVSWFNFCLCAYSHRFFRNNSVIQIYVYRLGTLLLAWVSLKSHLCSSSNSASTSVDVCRDTSDTTQICCDTSDTTQKLSVYRRKIVKMSVYLR